MELEQFNTLCADIVRANYVSTSPDKRRYFRAVNIGTTEPSNTPPKRDEVAQKGYEVGREIRRNL